MANRIPLEWLEQVSRDWLPDDLNITINAKIVEAQMERLRGIVQMQQVYQGAIDEVTTKLKTLDAEFSIRYEHNPIHHIESRLKSPHSMLEKLKRKGLPLTTEAAKASVMDVAGVRVICSYIEDIYKIADMLEGQSDITPIRRRDYIANPKPNGYRSLHLIVKVPVFLSERTEEIPVEVQIRTIAMDFWASLEHEIRYKSVESVPETLRERLARCANASAALDEEMQEIHRQCRRQ